MTRHYYPPVGFYFSVDFSEISDLENDTRFQSVSGLEVQINTEPLKEGGENRFEHALPVKTQYSNLILKRGLLRDSKLIQWCLNTFDTLEIEPINLGISLLNEKHQPLMTWNIIRAWPLKWSVSEFNAEQNNLAVETMEFKYNYFTVLKT